jgi:hypothetical protein
MSDGFDALWLGHETVTQHEESVIGRSKNGRGAGRRPGAAEVMNSLKLSRDTVFRRASVLRFGHKA